MTSEAAHLAIMELARAVAIDPVHDEFDWTALSLVLGRQAHAESISKIYGYVYLADGTWRVSDTDFDVVLEPCATLVSAMAKDEDDPGFVRCLLQIARPSGETNVEFEHEDSSRWSVNPDDWDELPEALRPNFGEAATSES